MPASKLYFGQVRTSETHSQEVTVTAISIKNDIDGNPRYRVQVWITRKDDKGQETGSLWHPKVKGYRLYAGDYYILNGVYNLNEDMTHFIHAFEKAVRA